MRKVTSDEGWAIFNEGCLVLPNVKTKPEGFEVVKPSRLYATFSVVEIVNNLEISSFSHNKLFHNDPFVLGLLA